MWRARIVSCYPYPKYSHILLLRVSVSIPIFLYCRSCAKNFYIHITRANFIYSKNVLYPDNQSQLLESYIQYVQSAEFIMFKFFPILNKLYLTHTYIVHGLAKNCIHMCQSKYQEPCMYGTKTISYPLGANRVSNQ